MPRDQNPEQGSPEYAALVADQNDRFRRTVCLGEPSNPLVPGRLVWTAAINARGSEFFSTAKSAIGAITTFEPDNDPDGFHDFGSVDVEGETVWFKVDHYDQNYEYGSDDPSDLAKTRRVMTILFPSDW